MHDKLNLIISIKATIKSTISNPYKIKEKGTVYLPKQIK